MSKKIISLLALSLLLTIASAYEANLVKTLFYLDEDNTFTQPFFQTKNNIIGYNVIAGETEALSVPHFTTINLQNTSASLFFENTMNACGQNNAIYLRMFYHSNTSTLVYYCTLNNTLLILDEDDYTVKNTVPVYTTGLFNETKIYAEGTSVVILGIANSYSYLPNSTATQLIKINLESMQVVRQVTFDKGLEDGEVVTAYTSGNLLSFVLTTQVNLETNTVTSTIYSVVFAGNLYTLIQVTTFNYSFPQDIFYFNPSELATLDSYLVANNYKNLLFYTITGNLAYNFTDLQFVVQQTVEDYLSVNIPVYAMQYGSSTLYAQFTNTSIVQFSASGSSLNWHSLYQISASTNFVLGNQYNGDLLFATATNFNIIDLKTSQVTYTVQTALEDTTGIGLTNSTYIVYQLTNTATDSVTVFDLKTNLAIGAFNNHSSNVGSSYYDQVNNVYYYIEAAVRDLSQCTVKFFDAKSLVTGDVFSYDVSSDYIDCWETHIEHLQSTDQEHSPNFVISLADGVLWKEYLIHTQTQDRLIAIWPNMIDISTYVFADYDNLTFYYLTTSSDENSTVETYVYDENTNDLNLEDTYNISNIPNNKTQYGLQINSSTIAFISGTQCGLVNFAERTSVFYDFPNYANINVSSFQDVEGQTHLIISDMGGVESPSMLDMDGTVSQMPEFNKYTQRAASAGASSFFLVDDFGAGVQAVRFYDSFSENSSDGRQQIELDYDYMIEDILQ